MIELATAALIAKTAADAVGAFDKIYRGFSDFVKDRKKSKSDLPPPDFAYVDAPEDSAFVAKSRHTGGVYQTVTYGELCEKLEGSDLKHIEALSKAMSNYEHQWNTVVEQRSMASGMEIGKLDAQMDYLARQIADTLKKVLLFVERMGLHLDDHYYMARSLAEDLTN